MKLLTLSIMLSFTLLTAGCGISSSGLKSDPGYARLIYPNRWKADTRLNVNLGPFALRTAMDLVAIGEGMGEEELAFMEKVKGVRVRIYNVGENASVIKDYMAKSARQLADDGWVQTVKVNDIDENVIVMLKFDKQVIDGLSVMTLDHHEAVFVNIIGDLDPAFFDRVMNEAGVEASLAHVVF